MLNFKKFIREGDGSTNVLIVVVLVGVSVLTLRLLIYTDTFNSALLYIAWPFGLSLALYYLTPHTDGTSWMKRCWNNFRTATIALLACSLMLMEGYVCVLMALPIFFFAFLIAFFVAYANDKWGKKKLTVQLLPALVLLVSLEGVTDFTTVPRFNEVVHSQIVPTNVATIKQRLATPPKPRGNRNWLISVFPMPKTIGTLGLNVGDVRIYEFVYHRWFSTNTHTGRLSVTLVEAETHRFKTKIEDTSYIAGYMKLHGTELLLEPVGDSATRVTLTVRYDRAIDPAWYFGPLQRYAVEKASEYFIKALLGPDETPSVSAGSRL